MNADDNDERSLIDHNTKKRPRFSLWVKSIVYIFVSLLIILFVVANNYHVDKVIIQPGTAENVSDAITIRNARHFPSKGKIRFLTVLVSSSQPSYMTYLVAKYFDKNSDIFSWKEINGDQTTKQSEEFNNALMKQSQNAAIIVALERLGCTIGEDGSGALVQEVQKGSPAYGKIKVEDVITSINNLPVNVASDLSNDIKQYAPGDKVEIGVMRGSNELKVDTILGARKSSPERGFLGVYFFTYKQQLHFPVDVKINPGDVSGPSAGLAFTLSIIDQLTSGELSGGKDIAVTGEILPDSSVAPVGGVAQKAVAARRSGASILIVPKGEGRQARKNAGPMKVYEVSNLDDALRALEKNGGTPLSHVQTCPS